jgi:hypothetical protein
MSAMTRRRGETEGRRGSRIDTDEGGRYVGIPLNGQCSVQETGCGTPIAIGRPSVQAERPASSRAALACC